MYICTERYYKTIDNTENENRNLFFFILCMETGDTYKEGKLSSY